MEIEVTDFITRNSDDMMAFSASRAEIGDNAGQETWNCSIVESEEIEGEENALIKDVETYLAAVDHFKEYGAWTEFELFSMSLIELQALLIQEIASQYRYLGTEECHSLFQGDIEGDESFGKWFIYLGL